MNEKKNKPDAAALRDAKRGHKARIGYARIVLVCLLGALLAVPAFAEGGASGPLDTIKQPVRPGVPVRARRGRYRGGLRHRTNRPCGTEP